MSEKMHLELKNVQETLLLPLWGRAEESKKENPLLTDQTAQEIIDKIDYDFSIMNKKINPISQLGWVARSLEFDSLIRQYIKNNPYGTIVNLGCGFDTTFERIDNGQINWYDLDLSDVKNIRKKLIPESERRKYISASIFDEHWLKEIVVKDNVLFIAAGLLYYYTEDEVRNFIVKLIEKYNHCEIVFDGTSNKEFANKMVLKRGKINSEALLQWEIKDSRKIKECNKKIKEVREFSLFENVRNKKK